MLFPYWVAQQSSRSALRYMCCFIMAGLRSRCGHYIFVLFMAGLRNRQAIIFLSCSLFFVSPFFLSLSKLSQIGCLPYFYTCCGLSANLGRRSETCCTQLAEYTRRKNRQKFATGLHRTTLSGCIFATETYIDNRTKAC